MTLIRVRVETDDDQQQRAAAALEVAINRWLADRGVATPLDLAGWLVAKELEEAGIPWPRSPQEGVD